MSPAFMSRAPVWRALTLAGLLAVAPLAYAKSECLLDLGHGWPPATQNHGSAVEQLFADGDVPALSLVRLPVRGKESGVMLMRPVRGNTAWALRSATASERVDSVSPIRGGISRSLKTDQSPRVREVPMPAALAERLLDTWQRTLQAAVPAESAAVFHDGELLLFTVDDQRVTGLEPTCGPARMLVRQSLILIEASDTKEKNRYKRWRDLAQSLDRLDEQLADLD